MVRTIEVPVERIKQCDIKDPPLLSEWQAVGNGGDCHYDQCLKEKDAKALRWNYESMILWIRKTYAACSPPKVNP